MKISDFKNKQVIIWGDGKEGRSVKKLLQESYPQQDIKIIHNDEEAEKFFCSDYFSSLENKNSHDYVLVRSAGVSIYKPVLQNAKKADVKITTPTNIFLTEIAELKKSSGNNQPITIAITGTKGKSTTATLLNSALQSAGYKTALAGNIGVPLSDLLLAKNQPLADYDFIIMETSSYQASDLYSYPDIAILLNLFPEHIQWHGTHEQYYKDKLQLFAGENTVKFVAEDFKEKLSKFLTIPSSSLRRGSKKTPKTFVFGTADASNLAGKTKLLGEHNLINFAAVIKIMEYLKIPFDKYQNALQEFKGLPHRLEIVATKDGICYVDDSISTTPETAIAALNTFQNKNIVIILGGQDRQQDFSLLAEKIVTSSNIKAVVTLGETGERISQILQSALQTLSQDNGLKIISVANLAEAVTASQNIFNDLSSFDGFDKDGESGKASRVILLSPAAPSYDMYESFTTRGEEFASLVNRK